MVAMRPDLRTKDGDEDPGPTCGIATFCCGLLLFWPAAVFLTGWNEHSAVCREWALEEAGEKSAMLNCASATTDTKGSPVEKGGLGFLSCPVDKTTFKSFTSQSFEGLAGLPAGTLFAPGAASAAAMRMTVAVWQCEEYCEREECYRRLEDTDVQEGGEHSEDIAEETRSLFSRRTNDRVANTRRLKKSCTPRCVDYGYRRVLSTSELSQHFHEEHDAENTCGQKAGYINFHSSGIKVGTSEVHAPPGSIGLSPASHWTLNDNQIRQLPIEVPVDVKERSRSLPRAADLPSMLTDQNTQTINNQILTCAPNSEEMGCAVITFQKAVPNQVTVLSGVSKSMKGQFDDAGWNSEGYWLCKGSGSNHVDRICPSVPQVNIHKGFASCGEDITTLEQLMSKMKGENTMKQWVLRAVGFILMWLSISMCFQPLKSILGWITNSMDTATDCIPFVGDCVDTLTDIFMGIVKCLLCIVTFCCAGACFLFIIAFMWTVMRPLMGGLMFIAMCCCCIGACGLLFSQKGKGAKMRERRFKPSADDDEDEGSDEVSDDNE